MRPERVNKWPNFMTDIWWWWSSPKKTWWLYISLSYFNKSSLEFFIFVLKGKGPGVRTALLVGRSRDRFPVVSMGIFSVIPQTELNALRSTQPLKVSTRDFSWGKGGRCVWLTTYHPCSAETSGKSRALTYPEPLGPPRPLAGDLHFLLKGKAKQSRNRSGVAQRVPGGLGSQISMTLSTWRWWGCQPYATAVFTPKNISATHFH